MNDTLNLLHKALIELTLSGLSFSLIRGNYNSKCSGDIDIIAFDEHSHVLESLGYILFSSRKNNFKYIKFDNRLGEWIHLDVQTALYFGNLKAPASFTTELMKSSYKDNNGILRLEKNHELILLIFHIILNKGLIEEKYSDQIYTANINNLIGMENYYDFLPDRLGKYLSIIRNLQEGKIKEKVAIQTIANDFLPLNYKKNTLAYRIYLKVLSIINGSKVIAILGPDGSGKTTLLDVLVKLKWPSIRKQYMGPGDMDEIRLPFKKLLIFLDILRSKREKSSIIGLLSRVGWQATCYFDFIERVYKHTWFWASGGVVLFDRYACDMYFRKPTKINEIIFLKFFPKPKFIFLCVGDAELIYKRKPEELSINNIDNTINLYRKKLKEYQINFIEVDTTLLSPEDVINKATRNLINHNWYAS